MATKVGFQLESSLASGHLTDAQYIKGGYIVVATTTERDALVVAKNSNTDGVIVTGSLVYVSGEQKSYRYSGTAWQEVVHTTGTVTSISASDGLETASGTAITSSGTIKHSTPSGASSGEHTESGKVINSITTDGFGHVTGVGYATLSAASNQTVKTSTVSFGADEAVEIAAGTGGTLSVTGDATNKKITIESKLTATDTSIDW